MRRILRCLTVLMILLIVVSGAMAQNPASVYWFCMPPDSQKVSATAGNVIGLPEIGSPGFQARDYKEPATKPIQYQRWWPSEDNKTGISWGPETTLVATRYIQFALQPKSNIILHADSVTIYLGAKGTDKIRTKLFYDTDTSFSNKVEISDSTLWMTKDTAIYYNFPINADISDNQVLYVRIYPWNSGSASNSKYLYVRECTVYGTTEDIPVAANALWPFESDDQPVTSGLVTAQQQAYSDAMKFYNVTQLPTTTTSENVTCGTIQTVSKSWNAEPNPADSLYFQYAVAPKFGGTLNVTAVSMYIGGWYTSNMRAAMYYSKDSTFTTKTLLIADTLLAGNAVMPLEATLDEIVSSGETFYLRVYPHNTEAVGWAKMVAVDSVMISGTTTGVTAEPPTVTTGKVTYISTTFVTAGGTVTSDGGSAVLTRGVCWDTTTAPTIDKSKTENGSGSGTFSSQLTGLTAGTTYYLRAYAINAAGTAYGEDVAFKTLDSIDVPTVVTAAVSNIMVKTASCGGNVTEWGGDTVAVRGVCWNLTGNPTIVDNITENGSGLGTFTSSLAPLVENTIYYVRAYATNSKGTGYGAVDSFTTQTPAEQITKIVAADGTGDYTTVQAAFDAIPNYYTGPYVILIRKGVYYEKLLLDRYKTNVILIGEDVDSTILTYDDYAGKAGGTSMSYSVAIDADDFLAMNITFRNTVKNDGSFTDQQAVALRVNGDRQAYYNCKLFGYQDTYYTWGGRGTARVYMNHCYIAGSVDFIFGRDIAVFDSCELHINRNGGTLTAASTEADSKFGYVFRDCIISADSIGFNEIPIVSFYLGRPWQASPRTVFIRCEEPKGLNAAGWIAWNVPPALYAEYQCTGPGSDYSNRASISRQLIGREVADYTLENIFSKSSSPDLGYDWTPAIPDFIMPEVGLRKGTNVLPTAYRLAQNYPNPFNPVTTIKYDLLKPGRVTITLYNLLGEKVMTLVNAEQPAGYHSVMLDGSRLASGIYFYRIEAGEFRKTMKMMLLK